MKNTEKNISPTGFMGFGKTSMDFGGFYRFTVQAEIGVIHCEGS